MLDATVNKLLHSPTAALRQQSATADGAALASIVRVLFQLADPSDPSPEADASDHHNRS
jgi:glutamyl-tRNA reductase